MALTGEVSSRQEAMIPVEVLGSDDSPMTVRAVIDTGFTGFLTLPLDIVSLLGLTRLDTTRVLLGDGSRAWVRVYDAVVIWDGEERFVSVHATEGVPLVGMSLLHGYHLGMDIVDGGPVTIAPI
jgi:clan AA aspartic protease